MLGEALCHHAARHTRIDEPQCLDRRHPWQLTHDRHTHHAQGNDATSTVPHQHKPVCVEPEVACMFVEPGDGGNAVLYTRGELPLRRQSVVDGRHDPIHSVGVVPHQMVVRLHIQKGTPAAVHVKHQRHPCTHRPHISLIPLDLRRIIQLNLVALSGSQQPRQGGIPRPYRPRHIKGDVNGRVWDGRPPHHTAAGRAARAQARSSIG
mmetsp:Transcript_4695/g.10874  ORF Transcript_4695/g.10874 Transcript_4695/m.10874 type:complete len:207 (+) Transcript_4695:1939-2559(+)